MTTNHPAFDMRAVRNKAPETPEHLYRWVREFCGVSLAQRRVCRGHAAPFGLLCDQYFNKPPLTLWHAPRGSGKSFVSALDTHLVSRWSPQHGTRILGGSKAQSSQIYSALGEIIRATDVPGENDEDQLEELLAERALYRNGSHVSILTASRKSVRGPHVPDLKLDEVDEIDPGLREDAIGMAMERRRGGKIQKSRVLMTSTWHNAGGPMTDLMGLAGEGKLPAHTYCVFEVLERCPESRSGPRLENCPKCPIVAWCHADLEAAGTPKAKRSRGHYTIESLIQKATILSPRAFDSDFLCKGPRADGLWFTTFDKTRHVTEAAEFSPFLPLHITVDSGVYCAAVFFQIWRREDGSADVRVFQEHLGVQIAAGVNAQLINNLILGSCNGRRDRVTCDPTGRAATAIGPTAINEFIKNGLHDRRGKLEYWDHSDGSVRAGLDLIESLLLSATGRVSLTIHPRCTRLIAAFENYRRAKRGVMWLDRPEEVNMHPHEDLMDALRGGLLYEFPEGVNARPSETRVPAMRVFK